MATITIMDPVTRIEGHMKVEITVDQQAVTDARCTGTLFRGFESILKGRDPWDAPVITQRICGVCPTSHAQASVLALEDANGASPPTNGRLLRNLNLGANFIQSHILHFYMLSAQDYAKGPQSSPWTPAWDVDIRYGAQSIMNHLGQALEARRRAHEMGAVIGGKMPASHIFIPGGVTAPPTADRIAAFKNHLDWLRSFIRNVYIPDVELLSQVYTDYYLIGLGYKTLLAYGAFELDDTGRQKLFTPGYVEEDIEDPVAGLDTGKITESVMHSWYKISTNDLNPANGDTRPDYPKDGAYSWLKAPRLSGKPFEAGPLARMWVSGDYRYGISAMDRHAARAQEALKIADAMDGWLNELAPGSPVYGRTGAVSNGAGVGMTEAPRGALGHWVQVSNNRISHYQVVTPTCWNASPKDSQGMPGPMEKALIGTPVQDPARPIEALRVIHSFDPCLSCAVHVFTPAAEPAFIRISTT